MPSQQHYTQVVVSSDLLQSKSRVAMKYALNIYTVSGKPFPWSWLNRTDLQFTEHPIGKKSRRTKQGGIQNGRLNGALHSKAGFQEAQYGLVLTDDWGRGRLKSAFWSQQSVSRRFFINWTGFLSLAHYEVLVSNIGSLTLDKEY